jgi:hypothetical protein
MNFDNFFENKEKNVREILWISYNKAQEIMYVIGIYLMAILDKYQMFQLKIPITKRDHLPMDFKLTHDNIFVDLDKLTDTYSMELKYGKMISHNIRLDINDNTGSVCVISESINPYFIFHIAKNMKLVQFHVYTKNRAPYTYINLENVKIFYIEDIYDTHELYDRMYVGLHVCSADYEQYYDNLKKKMYTNGKMIIQTIVSLESNSNNSINLRNTLSFRNFFNNKHKGYANYIIPPLCSIIKKYKLIDIMPIKHLENDTKLLKTKHDKYTQPYDLILRAQVCIKLMGNKYYVANFEY